MYYRIMFILAAAISLGSHAAAAPIQLVFQESTYEPGSPILFSVILPTGINDLGAYEIQIVLTGNTAAAGVDYGFDLGATESASSKYVFDSNDLFFDALLAESATSQVLLLTDLTLGSRVDISAEVNDRVADVVVFTSPNYGGPLMFSIDADSLILDTPAGNSVAQLASIGADISAAQPITILVPEPSAFGLGALVAVAYVGRRRRPISLPPISSRR